MACLIELPNISSMEPFHTLRCELTLLHLEIFTDTTDNHIILATQFEKGVRVQLSHFVFAD
jgi:hypothetical protein